MARYGFAALFAALFADLLSAASAIAAEPSNPTLAAQQAACTRGDGRACFDVADRLERGTGLAKDLVRALTFHIRACELKQGEACYRAGSLLDSASGAPDVPRATQFYRKGCELNSANGCFSLGFAYRLGKGVAKNEALGTSLMDKGCAMGSSGCKFLREKGLLPPRSAAAPAPARAAPPPVARAVPAAPAKNPMDDPDTSCRTNPDKKAAALACNDLGVVMEMDMGDITGQPEFKRALWYFDRACALGGAGGCNSAGIMYSEGKIGARGNPPQADHVTAFGYFRRACELEPKGCWEVAGAYEEGRGMAKSLATAEQFYRQSCRADPEFACWLTGNFLDRTKRGKPGEVVALYEGACKQSYPKACREAAVIYENGKGVAKDRGKAESLRQLACMMTGEEPCPPLDPAPAAAQAVAPKPSPAPPAAATARQAAPAASQAKRSAREPVVSGSALARGIALYREKDFQPALAMFLAAAKQDPGDPRAYAYLAGTYDWLGMSVESRMAADTARRIDPDALSIVQFAFGGP